MSNSDVTKEIEALLTMLDTLSPEEKLKQLKKLNEIVQKSNSIMDRLSK